VRREVWRRDDGRCQWPVGGRAGGICGSRLRVEYDHVVPRARSGSPTARNLRLLCHFHNQIAARLAFGDAWMDRFASGVPPPTR
jgi:5-methylcytosine-specific restriction endonuclease McrA